MGFTISSGVYIKEWDVGYMDPVIYIPTDYTPNTHDIVREGNRYVVKRKGRHNLPEELFEVK